MLLYQNFVDSEFHVHVEQSKFVGDVVVQKRVNLRSTGV